MDGERVSNNTKYLPITTHRSFTVFPSIIFFFGGSSVWTQGCFVLTKQALYLLSHASSLLQEFYLQVVYAEEKTVELWLYSVLCPVFLHIVWLPLGH
jgi:hypothetical protein